MRTFELIFTTVLLLAIMLELISGKRRGYSSLIYGIAVLTAIAAVISKGFRFAMAPLYLLSLALFLASIIKNLFRKESELKAKKSQRILHAAGSIMFCFVFILSAVFAWFLPINNLPEPSGKSKVGTVFMDFNNPYRTNLLTGRKELQRIGVQIWYPADDIHDKKRINWLLSRNSASLFAKSVGLPDVFGQLTMVKTNSYLNAPLSAASRKYPVILFSGGSGMFNGQNTIQMEELASNGYIVIAVSHPKDDFVTRFADGTELSLDMKMGDVLNDDMSSAIKYMKSKYKSDHGTPEMQRTVIQIAKVSNADVKIWAEDMIFAADQIDRMNDGSIKSMFKGKIDTRGYGIFGHSFGGAAAGQACLDDSRFKAFINIDGTPFGDSVKRSIKQPFMVLSAGLDSSAKFRAGDGYSSDQKNYTIVSVRGAEHMNFTDLNRIMSRIGKLFGILGRINSDRAAKITNTYVLAFFNHYLKGSTESVLNEKNSYFSEVGIEQR